MGTKLCASLLGLSAALLTVLPVGGAFQQGGARDFTMLATPPGVTLEPSLRATPMAGGLPVSVTPGFLADANGMTLYTYASDATSGKPSCVAECATAWPPLLAAANAVATADWTLVDRGNGAKQWAYKGRPLYRSLKDAKPGDVNGNGVDGAWRAAAIEQAPDEVASPAGITLKPLNSAGGDIFVDRSGMTLYLFDGDTPPGGSACVGVCLKIWIPLAAGELAKPVGDWSTIRRDDGGRQWAFRGRPLYTFTGDRKPGDANGIYVDPRWRAAALRHYFLPAEVKPRLNGGVPVLATADGMTLYARDRFRFSFGGYSVNDGPPPTPAVGRAIGPSGCEGDCVDVWVPLAANPDSQPSGYWSIVARDDGRRQWAYQGYPLYSNKLDKKPGDMLGRDLFDLTDGSHALYWRVATP